MTVKYKLYHRGEGLTFGIQDTESGDSFIEGSTPQWEEYQAWLALGNTPIPLPPSQYYDLVGDDWVYDIARHKSGTQAANRTACTAHILASYSIEIQSSMSLGIYPGVEVEAMTTFIAACIAEENRCFDLIEAAMTEEEINAITPTWMEV